MSQNSPATPLTLPSTHWGDQSATRRVLLLHGLSSNAQTWWRMGEALASDGWAVTAVDLRGHGTAPLADNYSVAAYASDLPGTDWDLVIGHSLGGAISVIAAQTPGFAGRLVLLDPALIVPDAEWSEVREEQLRDLTFTADSIRASQPRWHDRDIETKVAAIHQAGESMIEGTLDDNHPWTVLPELEALQIPTLILTGDPAIYTMFPPDIADAMVATNANLEYRVIRGAAHSPHREQWDSTIAEIRGWVAE